MSDGLIDAQIALHWAAWERELRCREYDTAAYYAKLYLSGQISFERAQIVWDRVDARLKRESLRP